MVPETTAKSQRYEIMDDKVERLLRHVGRPLMHVRHSVPPEVVVVDDIEKLIDEVRMARKERSGSQH